MPITEPIFALYIKSLQHFFFSYSEFMLFKFYFSSLSKSSNRKGLYTLGAYFLQIQFFFFLYFPIFPFSHFGSNLFIELFKKKKVNLYNLNKIRDTSHTFMILKKIFYYICTYLYLKVEGDIKRSGIKYYSPDKFNGMICEA